jgi:VanZ family protein
VSWLRWAVWAAFGVAWSAALLTTFPVSARDAVLPTAVGFSAGKLLHVGGYAAFAALTALLPVSRPWRWLLLAFVSLHAFGSEFLQQFVDRTPSLLDVGLDHAGIALGVAVTWPRWRAPARASA